MTGIMLSMPAMAQSPKLGADNPVAPLVDLADANAPAGLRTGVVDAHPAFAAALAAGPVRIPCGTYELREKLVIRHSMIADGTDCVTIRSTVVDDDMLYLPPGTSNLRLSGFRLWSSSPALKGAAIALSGTMNITITGITTAATPAPFNEIIRIDNSANTTFIDRFQLTGARGSCIRITGTGMAQAPIETHIRDGVLSMCHDGLLVEDGSGLYADNIGSLANRNAGFRIAIAAGNVFYGASFKSDYADTNAGHGFSFECGTTGCGHINHVTLSGDWWAAASGSTGQFTADAATTRANAGLHVDNPNLDGLIAQGGTVRANGGHGIWLRAGRNIIVANSQIFQNGFAAYDVACGIWFETLVTKLTLSGNIVGDGGVDASPLQGSRRNGQAAAFCRPTPGAKDPPVEIIMMGNIMTGNIRGSGALVGAQPGDRMIGGPGFNIGW